MIRRIDHVVVEAKDEQRLFDFLTGTFGLPVSWPVAQWGALHEGGVGVGSCNLGCNHRLDPNSSPEPTVRAIAFEPSPSMDAAVEAAAQRSLAPTPPQSSGVIHDLPDSAEFAPWRRGWTVSMILGGPLDPLPFLCQYDHDTASRVCDEQQRLDALAGGPLGITGLEALVVHAADREAAAAAWAGVAGRGVPGRPGAFAFESGPELQIEPGTRAPALVFGVRSLEGATRALDGLGIGHDDDDGGVRVDPQGALGLDLRLVSGG